MRHSAQLVLVIATAALLGACGQMGPLYMPTEEGSVPQASSKPNPAEQTTTEPAEVESPGESELQQESGDSPAEDEDA